MSRKDILLIANYWHFEQERASSRYRSFADILAQKYDLEVITSTFCHLKKSQRDPEILKINELPYKVTLQYEKGYNKNISLKRISSYKQFGESVYKYLQTRKKPDAIIVSVPSLTVADLTTKFAKKEGIPVIVDIQDLWPEAFKMAIDIPIISNIAFYPMKKQAQRIYSRADKIMAVSNTYCEIGKACNNTAEAFDIYIGTDSALIKEKIADIDFVKPNDEFWVGYVGALGHSYDIKRVIEALSKIKETADKKIVFKVMGDGVLKEKFMRFAAQSTVKCDFTGLLEYGVMMKNLMMCDVAVNPIISQSVSSIINKVSDYAAAGVAVVNTQNSAEYRNLIEKYEAGINVDGKSIDELADALEKLYSNESLRRRFAAGQERLFSERFDRSKTYPLLVSKLESMFDK